MNRAKPYVEMFKERDSICVSHYPVPVSQHAEPEVRALMELDQVNTKDTPVALYLHIPFCDATCSFCPFNRYLKRQDQVDRYLDAVRHEIDSYAATPFGSSITVSSINLGGGTPSCLSSEELTGLLQYLKQSFRVEEEAMIFIEGNPGISQLTSWRCWPCRASTGSAWACRPSRRSLPRCWGCTTVWRIPSGW
ncbi:hypothetical protein ACFSQ7_43105 [Paenibacillus rhizoplanae]